jgi:hypothetical protein
MKSIGDCIKNFSEPFKQKSSFEQLVLSMSPVNGDYISSNGQNLIATRSLTEVCFSLNSLNFTVFIYYL